MLTSEEALQMISKSSKRQHSIQVSKIMKYLANFFQADKTEWEITGLLHDLDYDLTGDASNQHGVLAASILGNRVPENIKQAIRAHHPTTGYNATTLLDRALIFADCFAWLIDDQFLLDIDSDLVAATKIEAAQKPLIVQKIENFAKVSLEDIIWSIKSEK
jgi:putative nucleotidyltransferase with HDIG domain